MNTKSWKTPARAIAAALIAGGALMGASSAFAQSAPYGAPYGLRAEAAPQYGQPHMMPVDARISIGWHEDRYWDGHRYWAHDEWMHHHPHDPGPPHYRDDHRPPPPRY
ncbi:hypothetical protein [Paraburkholderia sp. J76]|uniref:hypothetical protein n=1 Tax=Paraburkholderia sp. J76 TaxID=2805439 RepID=UPI002ABD7AE3|nr:hypothetical protein [Paraburkholderia sp. J76]